MPSKTLPLPEPICALFLSAISASSAVAEIDATPLKPSPASASGALFEMLDPATTGFGFVSELQVNHPLGLLYVTGFACGGVAIGDIDGDGWPDIFCAGGAGKNALYRQIPKAAGGMDAMRFEDITSKSPGLDGGEFWGTGCAMADLDRDGDLDIYVCRYDAPNGVFLNDGSGKFISAPDDTGLEIRDSSITPAFADYDNDGDLDLYLLTNRYEDPNGYRGGQAIGIGKDGKPIVKKGFEKYYKAWFEDFDHWGVDLYGRADYLLRNDSAGDGSAPKFVDVTEQAGIRGRGDGNSVTWWDYNLDGFVDVYVGNDFISPDRLYRNNGDGTFTNVIAEAFPHMSWFSMGSDFGDLDGDGWPEFLSADMSATNHFKQKTTMGVMGGNVLRRANTSRPPQYMRNAFLVNTGTERFYEAAFLSGIDSSDWTWAVLFADYDLDGAKDLFVTNGTPRAMNDSDLTLTTEQLALKPEWEYTKNYPVRAEKNRAFRNVGDLKFEDVSDAWGLGLVGVSYSAAYGDLDRDGDLDLVVLNVDDKASIYRNGAKNANRIAVELRGTKSNHRGVGARIEVRASGKLQTYQVLPDRGFMGGCDTVATFGVADGNAIESLAIHWPSGAVQRFKNLASGKRYVITEPKTKTSPPKTKPRPTLFEVADAELRAHEDPPYDDFQHQSLLPNQLSALGPAAAWGDIDGDNDDDLFLGGGAGQAGAVYRNDKGKLVPASSPAFEAAAAAEDMGAVFLDADVDGDLDLFVVSGSYEFAENDPNLRDRLYLNDGKGSFASAPAGSIPDAAASGSCAAAADFDGDGDLDLFVGGRVTPRRYPLVPPSRLLLNDGGKFTDVTSKLAPELAETGMVTAGLWTDADGDGDPDLLVAHEWGPVKVFRNENGRLSDATAAAGLAEHTGWWNSLAGADLDGDGDIDYVAGNQGLNTKYHATPEKPVEVFYGDYHGDGKMCIVEAEWEGNIRYPGRGKSCSTRAMPQLAKLFPTFKSFALASLEEVYSLEKLDSALHLQAATLESSVLINDGKGQFTVQPLPRLAQISPAFGIAIEDFDTDGIPDVFLAQNFFGPQSETGRFDGGMGQLFRGIGDGTFAAVGPAESGVRIIGDMTSASATDLDGDARPDVLVARNADTPVLLTNSGKRGRPVAVRLKGKKGNPSASGARITLTHGETTLTKELHAGSGYLGSPTATAFFSLPPATKKGTITVRWPDGQTTSHSLPKAGITAVLSR